MRRFFLTVHSYSCLSDKPSTKISDKRISWNKVKCTGGRAPDAERFILSKLFELPSSLNFQSLEISGIFVPDDRIRKRGWEELVVQSNDKSCRCFRWRFATQIVFDVYYCDKVNITEEYNQLSLRVISQLQITIANFPTRWMHFRRKFIASRTIQTYYALLHRTLQYEWCWWRVI